METVTLLDLGPIIAAVSGPMLLFVAAAMRFQHVDSTKTRKLVTDSTEELLKLIAESRTETRDLIAGSETRTRNLISESETRTRDLIEKNRDLIDRNHQELSSSLADARERLARIEGHLRIAPPPQEADDDNGDAQAA